MSLYMIEGFFPALAARDRVKVIHARIKHFLKAPLLSKYNGIGESDLALAHDTPSHLC
jgi:hypothetical protein